MHFIIYAAPNYTENAVKFIEKLANIRDIRLGLISQEPLEWLRPQIRTQITAFHRVIDVFDTSQLLQAAKTLSEQQGKPYRIIGAVEQVQVPVAQVREALGIDGMSIETAKNFRDKNRMKALMRQAGLPCARHKLVTDVEQAIQFAAEVGFPLIVKPLEGAASQSTFKANNKQALKEAVTTCLKTSHGQVLLEEFIQGHEHSFDTFSLNGKPVFHSLTQYYPNPLEVVQEPWIQWQIVLPREVEDPRYDDIREAAFKTLDTLGMETGMSHLEWFRRKDGSIAISEVAARPPGAQITTLISRANDIDCITAWARLMIFGSFPEVERKFAVGGAYLRGQGQGKVVAVNGLDQIEKEIGHLITDVRFPKIGQEKSPSYEGEGYIILRHPETEVVKKALQKVVSRVRVVLG